MCADTSHTGWTRQTVDLSAFAGRRVQLQFMVNTNFSAISSWLIDDVALVPSAAASAGE